MTARSGLEMRNAIKRQLGAWGALPLDPDVLQLCQQRQSDPTLVLDPEIEDLCNLDDYATIKNLKSQVAQTAGPSGSLLILAALAGGYLLLAGGK